MTQGLVRKQQRGDLHFVTFSCYQRLPYLDNPKKRALFEDALEKMRLRYGFFVVGYAEGSCRFENPRPRIRTWGTQQTYTDAAWNDLYDITKMT
jgi:hypothetical protein